LEFDCETRGPIQREAASDFTSSWKTFNDFFNNRVDGMCAAG
jgi:hypothetical protein